MQPRPISETARGPRRRCFSVAVMAETLAVRHSWQGALIVARGDEDALLPTMGAPVNLVVDDVRVRAQIVGVAEGRFELAATVVPDPLRAAGTADARIEFVAEGGPCRLLGSAALASRAATETRPGLNVLFAHERPGQLLLSSDTWRWKRTSSSSGSRSVRPSTTQAETTSLVAPTAAR